MTDYFDINDMTEDFIKMCCNNNPETINYYNEIKEFRAYGQVKDFRKVIDENFNNFCYNNSLVHKINLGLLNDNQLLFYRIISYAFEYNTENNITVLNTLPSDYKNRLILNYYMKELDKNIENIKLENLKEVCQMWYDNIPSRYLIKQKKIEEIKEIKIDSIKPNFDLVKHTLDFLKIGNSLLFNVDGFPKNQIALLLYGMAVYYAWINMSKFKTFKDLINYLKSFIQINTYSKCLDVLDYKENKVEDQKDKKKSLETSSFYNLITYLKFKNNSYNYRYKCAEKYFKNSVKDKQQNNLKSENSPEPKALTNYEELPTGESYIKTVYNNIDEIKKAWYDLEEEFKNKGLTDKLITMWFNGQLLTRSTCLIGCMLIMLKEGKFIEFNKDEMPDWKAIALDHYEGTYKTKEELEDLKINENVKLVDVLYMLYNFMNNIKLQF